MTFVVCTWHLATYLSSGACLDVHYDEVDIHSLTYMIHPWSDTDTAHLPYNLYCVGGDVKHCSIQWSDTAAFEQVFAWPKFNLRLIYGNEIQVVGKQIHGYWFYRISNQFTVRIFIRQKLLISIWKLWKISSDSILIAFFCYCALCSAMCRSMITSRIAQ